MSVSCVCLKLGKAHHSRHHSIVNRQEPTARNPPEIVHYRHSERLEKVTPGIGDCHLPLGTLPAVAVLFFTFDFSGVRLRLK